MYKVNVTSLSIVASQSIDSIQLSRSSAGGKDGVEAAMVKWIVGWIVGWIVLLGQVKITGAVDNFIRHAIVSLT